MTKTTRELVYQKYKGRCAYCGHEITIKEMQVDHIVPQRLGGADAIENYNPSCRICNHYKRATRLENWRDVFLGGLVERIKKIYIVKVAERYGMITFHEWDNKFYFEKEAEEYFENECLHSYADTEEQLKEDVVPAFQKGAEFGYNKAKEEMQKNGLALQSDMNKTIEQNIQLKNQNNWLEGCKLELAEHLGKANDKISELKAQIEKMKFCGNCAKNGHICVAEEMQGKLCGKNKDKWELRR